jgi:hypothetical protein
MKWDRLENGVVLREDGNDDAWVWCDSDDLLEDRR